MTIKSWSSGALRVEYSDSWAANGGDPVHLSLSRRSGDTVTLALSLAEVGALINLLGDAAKHVASLRHNQSALELKVRWAMDQFNQLPPEKQAEMRERQRRSWVVGETMLAHPEMSRDEAEAFYDKVVTRYEKVAG